MSNVWPISFHTALTMHFTSFPSKRSMTRTKQVHRKDASKMDSVLLYNYIEYDFYIYMYTTGLVWSNQCFERRKCTQFFIAKFFKGLFNWRNMISECVLVFNVLTSQTCLWVKSLPQYLQVCNPAPVWIFLCCLML